MANVTDFGDHRQRLTAELGKSYKPGHTQASSSLASSGLATITGEIANSRFDEDRPERLSVLGAGVTITVASILSWVTIAVVFAVLV